MPINTDISSVIVANTQHATILQQKRRTLGRKKIAEKFELFRTALRNKAKHINFKSTYVF